MKTISLSPITLMILFLCYSNTGKAQKTEESKPYKVALTLNAFSIFDSNYPTLQAGIEGRFKSIAINYKYGPSIYIDKKKNPHSTQGELLSYKGHKQKIDIRWYNSKPKRIKDIHSFVGVEMFTSAFEKERQNGKFYDKAAKYEYSYDYVRQEIKVWGISAKLGFVHQLNHRFFLEYTNCLGIRNYTLIHHDGRNIQVRELNFGDKEWRFSYLDTEGKRQTPHYAAELTIMYRLSRS